VRKTLVVAAREYQAAVRTKTFLVGLLIMPLMVGGSIVLQILLKDVVDTADQRYALVNRTADPKLGEAIRQGVEKYNAKVEVNGRRVKPRILVEPVESSGKKDQGIEQQRYELSERVRKGELVGFLELDTAAPPKGEDKSADKDAVPGQIRLRYQSNRMTDEAFARLAKDAIAKEVRGRVRKEKSLELKDEKLLLDPALLHAKGLSERDPRTGKITEASEESRIASVAAPAGLMMLMFMVVLMGATPLMQGVVEEKMQRIAEVLLGSVRPFELMMGKLIGMAGVSLTITAVYLTGALWAAQWYGFAGALSPGVLAWFLAYQILAALMYGSLFIAIGAACTDMKETQNLLLPVMLLVSVPMFMLGNVLRDPNSPVAVGLSFFPFATPMLMVARLAVPPGIAWWQPVLGMVLVLATTVMCVYAAGRIFRVGILMQGKGARFGELVKWVFRG
jgi:ABC-type Na+ efflux pump permease subunit